MGSALESENRKKALGFLQTHHCAYPERHDPDCDCGMSESLTALLDSVQAEGAKFNQDDVALAKAEGAKDEREKVVRWLLDRVAFKASGIPTHENLVARLERGEHLK